MEQLVLGSETMSKNVKEVDIPDHIKMKAQEIVGDAKGREAALKISEWMDKNIPYQYYRNDRIYGVSPRMGKSVMCEMRKRFPFNLTDDEFYLTKLNISKVTLKECDSPKGKFEKLEQELVEKARDSLVERIKLKEPTIPEEVIRAFIKMYIGFEMNVTREVRSNECVVKVSPEWKPINEIDFTSEESRTLREYFY